MTICERAGSPKENKASELQTKGIAQNNKPMTKRAMFVFFQTSVADGISGWLLFDNPVILARCIRGNVAFFLPTD